VLKEKIKGAGSFLAEKAKELGVIAANKLEIEFEKYSPTIKQAINIAGENIFFKVNSLTEDFAHKLKDKADTLTAGAEKNFQTR
jgi:hypothetical protein